MHFEPVTTTDVADKVAECLRLASEYYGREFTMPDIRYDLRGNVAGRANGEYIRINPELLIKNRDHMINQTVPHEVAHVVVRQMYGRNAQSHGDEWRHVMVYVYGLEPDRCHSYETTPARVVKRKYKYVCACRVHMLTSIKHNRIQKGWRYICRYCNGGLRKG